MSLPKKIESIINYLANIAMINAVTKFIARRSIWPDNKVNENSPITVFRGDPVYTVNDIILTKKNFKTTTPLRLR